MCGEAGRVGKERPWRPGEAPGCAGQEASLLQVWMSGDGPAFPSRSWKLEKARIHLPSACDLLRLQDEFPFCGRRKLLAVSYERHSRGRRTLKKWWCLLVAEDRKP